MSLPAPEAYPKNQPADRPISSARPPWRAAALSAPQEVGTLRLLQPEATGAGSHPGLAPPNRRASRDSAGLHSGVSPRGPAVCSKPWRLKHPSCCELGKTIIASQIDRAWSLADFLRLEGRPALALAGENIAKALERAQAVR